MKDTKSKIKASSNPFPCHDLTNHQVNTTTIESLERDIQVKIPKVYHDLIKVFSKTKATALPPYRNYDCAIELLPGTTPPRGRLYSIPQITMSYGGIYTGGPETEIYCTLHLHSVCTFLLCRIEEWRTQTLH